MAFRIAHSAPQTRAKPVKDKSYLEWLHQLPCAITGLTPVQAAHLNTANPIYGHSGRGKGQKASDRWAIPLHFEKHADQHRMNEVAWWRANGINPWVLALSLHGCFVDDNIEGALRVLEAARIGELK